jgi:pyruvate dehydrogenase E1 component
LLARDTSGVLLNKMNTTVDGEFQRYTVEDGNYIRENFFGPDPRLREMVSHLSDDELRTLPRGGHDYRKLYAAFRAASENLGSGRPRRSSARPSRAGRSDTRSRVATPRTRSRR